MDAHQSHVRTIRIAILSPFLDRRHGTERVILEQIDRLSTKSNLEIHIYSEYVADLPGVVRYFPDKRDKSSVNSVYWHKTPKLPGPHVLAFIWWYFANRLYRWKDAHNHGLTYDLIYSPGINAADADAISIHVVFHELYRQVRSELKLLGSSPRLWPRYIHRHLYYRLIMRLERRIYTRAETQLAAVSSLLARQVEEFFKRSDVRVIPNAVDTKRFAPEIRIQRRKKAREQRGLSDADFGLLLIGNGWHNKGLDILLRSMAECRDLPLQLAIVGSDDRNAFMPLIQQIGLQDRVEFNDPLDDVMQFYSAADVYVGPSRKDAFGLPTLEAMACGLPVITSIHAGVSQAITDGVDGFVLRDVHDCSALAQLLRKLHQGSALRDQIGQKAARTAGAYTWDRNAAETWTFLTSVLDQKTKRQH